MTLDRESLIASFHSYGAPKEQWLIGGEFERAIVFPDGRPIPYEGAYGVKWYLEQLAARWNWQPVIEEGHLIALTRSGASITLEPAGQLELSGAPHATLHELKEEMRENRRELLELCTEAGHIAIACGLQPVTPIEDLPWMPKGRYAIMREYIIRQGDLAHHMMKGTCSVQCNYDFVDEEDCARKVILAAGLSPLVTAILANSPLYAGKPTGFMSHRAHIWTRTDPDRTGFPPVITDGFSYEGWVDYLMNVPMMYVKTDDGWGKSDGRTFGQWMQEPLHGRLPNESDWEMHQGSVFPEVRVKRTIEVRCADCVGHDLALAFCALFTGILYCDGALDHGLELVGEMRKHQSLDAQFDAAAQGGLTGQMAGRTTAEWADKLAALAQAGLENCLPEDLWMLDPLLERIEARRSPAQDLLDAASKNAAPEHIIAAVRY